MMSIDRQALLEINRMRTMLKEVEEQVKLNKQRCACGSVRGIFSDDGDWWTCSRCGDEWPVSLALGAVATSLKELRKQLDTVRKASTR